MEYISVHDISDIWNMKERKVTSLCRDGRIAGARKIGKTWMVPSNSLKPIDKRTKEYTSIDNTSISYTSSSDRVVTYYKNKYEETPMYTAFTPYRISPLGAHVDHNLGLITGFAIDKGIHIAYSLNTNGIIELESIQFPKKCSWHILKWSIRSRR